MKLTLLWRATEDVFNRIYDMEKIVIETQKATEQRIPNDNGLTA